MTLAQNMAAAIDSAVKKQSEEIINRLREMGFSDVNVEFSDTNIDTGKRKYSRLQIEASINLMFPEHQE